MKATVELTKQEFDGLIAKRQAWLQAFKDVSLRDLIAVAKMFGYAHYKFKGTYKPELVGILGRHPDADEIIMHVDGGFSHFGATCTVNTNDCSFSGRINTD